MNYASDFMIRSEEDLIDAVETLGIVPFFKNRIPGFSIEEHVDPKLWFSDEPGPWEWKGPVIRKCRSAYGKFSGGKAVYISRRLFTDFANFRRDGYDFDARFDDGLASFRDKELYELLSEKAPVLSGDLKKEGDYLKDGKKGFDTIITRLQAQCYVLISDFVYLKDRFGNTYGWGVAEYSTPERFFGPRFRNRVYTKEPEESCEVLRKQMKKLVPYAGQEEIERFLRK